MANQRKAGVERVTLTIPDDLLRAAEAEAARQGIDRLALMREAINAYVMPKGAVLQEEAAPYRSQPAPAAKAAKKAR